LTLSVHLFRFRLPTATTPYPHRISTLIPRNGSEQSGSLLSRKFYKIKTSYSSMLSFTTGQTIHKCAKVHCHAGAKKNEVSTLSRTIFLKFGVCAFLQKTNVFVRQASMSVKCTQVAQGAYPLSFHRCPCV